MTSGCWAVGGRALTAGSPQVLPQIPVKSGGPHGAGVLGEWLTPLPTPTLGGSLGICWQPLAFQMPNWGGRAGRQEGPGWGLQGRGPAGTIPSPPLPPGVHLEGPFISHEKRGAHPEAHLRSFEANAFQDLLATYGGLDNVRIVTLAPELGRSHEVIRALTALGICVSLGKGVCHHLGGQPTRSPGLGAESESGSPQGTQ